MNGAGRGRRGGRRTPAGRSGDADAYAEAVLAVVERIPPGRVMSYGAIAALLAADGGRGAPRRVGAVMARYGSAVCWHRVVRADGRPAPGHEERALALLRAEGTPLRGDRVDMARAAWWPPDPVAPLDAVAPPDPGAVPTRSRTGCPGVATGPHQAAGAER